MAVKTRTELKSENAADFPDNITGLISPADLRGQMDDVIDSAVFPEDGSGGGSGITVDTGESFKLIMLSDGTVRAIPIGAVAPLAPTGLALVARLTSVTLTWVAASGAVSYQVQRNGVNIGTSTSVNYRDNSVTVGNTYSYTVASVDQYQQRSPPSAAVGAVIDASLNHAPTDVVITCWPTPLPTDGPAFVRVNAREIDVQNMAMLLSVDAGVLTATNDPSVWIIRI